ncbi:MAG: hypothetical protein QW429_06650, partial [Thermoprotei archaeon]
AEAFAVPMLASIVLLLVRRSTQVSHGGLGWVVGVVLLSFGVVATHHWSTYILVCTLVFYFVYTFVWRRGVGFDHTLLAVVLAVLGLVYAYYAAQGFAGLRLWAAYGFGGTLVGYTGVIGALVAWVAARPSARGVGGGVGGVGFRWPLLVVVGLGVLGAVVGSARLLYVRLVSPELLLFSAATGVVLGFALIYGGVGWRGLSLAAWCVAPCALLGYAFFDGATLLIYRALVSLSVPAAVLFAVGVRSLLGRRGGVGRLVGVVLLCVLVGLGGGAEASVYVWGRGVYTGSTWYYPLGEVLDGGVLGGLLGNVSVVVDVPTSALLFYFYPHGATQVQADFHDLFRGVGSGVFVVVGRGDTSAFYYGGPADVGVNLTAPATCGLFYSSHYYLVYGECG